MRNLIILFLAVAIVSVGCQKDNTEIEDNESVGRVLLIEEAEGISIQTSSDFEAYGKPMDNIKVTVWYDESEYTLEDCCWFPPIWTKYTTVKTNSQGVFSFSRKPDTFDDRYKVSIESSDYHDRPLHHLEEGGNFDLGVYLNLSIPVVIIDKNPQSEDQFSMTTNTYKEAFEYSPIVFENSELINNGTERKYSVTVDTHSKFNAKLTLKVNGQSFKIIDHFTGSAESPIPLEIIFED